MALRSIIYGEKRSSDFIHLFLGSIHHMNWLIHYWEHKHLEMCGVRSAETDPDRIVEACWHTAWDQYEKSKLKLCAWPFFTPSLGLVIAGNNECLHYSITSNGNGIKPFYRYQQAYSSHCHSCGWCTKRLASSHGCWTASLAQPPSPRTCSGAWPALQSSSPLHGHTFKTTTIRVSIYHYSRIVNSTKMCNI